jgi:hypothetical protein
MPRRRSDGHIDSVIVNLLIVNGGGEEDKSPGAKGVKPAMTALH